MGYMHIDNLYKHVDFLASGETLVYALEKIHGTSAHVKWHRENGMHFFSGGEKHANFVALFDQCALADRFKAFADEFGVDLVTIYGEAYGGKLQGMKDVYGPDLKFVAFDVRLGGHTINGHLSGFVNVDGAKAISERMGFSFVFYEMVPCTADALDAARDRDSEQAIRNGIGVGKKGEGIVIRPSSERHRPDGARVIYKHKRPDFGESLRQKKETRLLDMSQVKILQDAQAIAQEWVTDERLRHVLDKLLAERIDVAAMHEEDGKASVTFPWEMRDTPEVIRAMLHDIEREGEGEIDWSDQARRSVCTAAAKLYKGHILGSAKVER